jgi:glycine/D-amino acid oxidase-like deaminating enzyme
MSSQASDSSIRNLISADPGLPRDNPTQPYWLHVQHPLANTQSQSLPKVSDIVVIGSGITGTSTTKFLLEGSSVTQVTLLEARSLCSGATGRNGGHCVTYGAAAYSEMKASVGKDMAAKFVKFTHGTCAQTMDAAREYAPEESQIRAVTRVRAFGDQESMNEIKESIEEFERDYPEETGRYLYLDDSSLREVILEHKCTQYD